MRELNFEQMEKLQGGQFHYSWQEHVGCAITGAIIGGGILSVAAYGACLLVAY